MKIYVASSWRNGHQPKVVEALEKDGHTVYDFRHPAEGDDGFHWGSIDKNWKRWRPEEFVAALGSPQAVDGFFVDMKNLEEADLTVLVLPSGTSSHLEAGFAVGQGQGLIIYYDDKAAFPVPGEPELMYKMAHAIVFGLDELLPIVRGYGIREDKT
jgi:hypothetical protein